MPNAVQMPLQFISNWLICTKLVNETKKVKWPNLLLHVQQKHPQSKPMTNTHKASLIRAFLLGTICVAMLLFKTEPTLPKFIWILVMIEWVILLCPFIEKDVE